MTLVFTSKEREKEFNTAIKMLKAICPEMKCLVERLIDEIEVQDNDRLARLAKHELLAVLLTARALEWGKVTVIGDWVLISNAIDALIWSDLK